MSTRKFHEIWIEQCNAAHEIKLPYGVKAAFDYLVAEKLLNFADAAARPALYQRHPREAPRRPGWPEEGRRHCRAQRLRPAAMVETERMVGSNCGAPPAKVGDGLIMVVSDPDIHRPARLHLEWNGDEAVAKARPAGL